MKIGYLLNMNDTTAIIATGKQYLSDAPKSVEPNTLMGNVYAQLGMPDSAFVYYDKALAIDPDYGYANLQKANLYYSTGDSTNYEKEITSVLLNKNIEVGTKVDILTDYIRTHHPAKRLFRQSRQHVCHDSRTAQPRSANTQALLRLSHLPWKIRRGSRAAIVHRRHRSVRPKRLGTAHVALYIQRKAGKSH